MYKPLYLLYILFPLLFYSCVQPREKEFMEMVPVRGGVFVMGDSLYYNNRRPLREITVSDFELGRYEVTFRQFSEFVHATSYVTDAERGEGSVVLNGEEWETREGVNWRHDSKGQIQTTPDCPVIHVSWNDALAFCHWLSERTGDAYRLPTEAEWEYAARGGIYSVTDTCRFSGGCPIDSVGWYLENSDPGTGVHPVGQKKPNALGLYDMTGNVWEWCSDWYAGEYDTQQRTDPQGPADGKRRVNRGGSWMTGPIQSHVTHRSSLAPEKQGNLLGFRVARNL